MTPEMIIALLGAGGLATIIPKLIDGINAHRTRRANDEKRNNRTALGQLERERDFRFRVEEWASGLVYMLKQMGVPDTSIPPKPSRQTERV